MQKISNISDPHFNLFFVYSGGGMKDLDHARQLEDNMTRSFLITLSKLEDGKQVKFIRELLSDPKPGRSKINLGGGKIKYDLQNLESQKEQKTVCAAEEKILLLISGISARGDGIDKSAFDINKFSGLKEVFEALEKLQKMVAKNEGKDLIRDIKEAYRANQKSGQKNPFKYSSDIEFDYDQLCSLYKGFHDSRPDGWIFSKKIAILIEAKVGTNAQDKWQLFRHLTSKNGFNINKDKIFGGEKCKDYRLVNKTWGEISDLFGQIDSNNNNMLVKEFREYLIMCGEILDLSFIVKEEEYNADKMSAQFPLLLSKLDSAISGLKIKEINGLTRARRPLDELWDYYGFKKQTKTGKEGVSNDPDYLIDFDEESACFALRTSSSKQMKILLKTDPESKNDNEFRRVILEVLNTEEKLNERYFISLKTDRIIDWRKGVQKGNKFDAFFFSIALSELQKKVTKRKPIEKIVDELFNTMLNLTPFTKRLSFGFKILYPDVTKIDDSSVLRKKNKELFEDSQVFIDFCTDFINDTKGIISMIKLPT